MRQLLLKIFSFEEVRSQQLLIDRKCFYQALLKTLVSGQLLGLSFTRKYASYRENFFQMDFRSLKAWDPNQSELQLESSVE